MQQELLNQINSIIQEICNAIQIAAQHTKSRITLGSRTILALPQNPNTSSQWAKAVRSGLLSENDIIWVFDVDRFNTRRWRAVMFPRIKTIYIVSDDNRIDIAERTRQLLPDWQVKTQNPDCKQIIAEHHNPKLF